MVSHYSGHGILSKVIILAGALCFSAYIGNRGSIPHTCETFQGITLASKPVQRCHYGELQGEGLPVFSSANCDVSAIEKKLGIVFKNKDSAAGQIRGFDKN